MLDEFGWIWMNLDDIWWYHPRYHPRMINLDIGSGKFRPWESNQESSVQDHKTRRGVLCAVHAEGSSIYNHKPLKPQQIITQNKPHPVKHTNFCDKQGQLCKVLTIRLAEHWHSRCVFKVLSLAPCRRSRSGRSCRRQRRNDWTFRAEEGPLTATVKTSSDALHLFHLRISPDLIWTFLFQQLHTCQKHNFTYSIIQ